MGTITYLILSIFCAVLQHETLASSSDDGAISSGSRPMAWIIKGPPEPEMEQGIRFLFMEDPTKVNIVSPDANGRYTIITGRGLAVHPHFVAMRPHVIPQGSRIASYKGNKIKYFKIDRVNRSPKDNVLLLFTEGLILLDNGHRLTNGFSVYNYGQREYSWVKFIVEKWIEKHTLPIRHYRGDED